MFSFIKCFLHPFFITFCFYSLRFALTSVFRFHFCLIFCFLDLLLLQLISCTSLSVFFEPISPSCCIKKKKSNIPFLLAWVTSQCPFCSHTSPNTKKLVHFPCCWALFHIYLFLHVCPFFDFSFFVLFSCPNFFSFLFSFLNVVHCWFLFLYLFFFLKTLFGLNIVFLSF